MSTSKISSGAIEALTDKELEILRLLTNGHTVKSIAARLGRSETSINERLRDARRKTGIGSSRELARTLAAQKIWDKKIDLSSHSSATEITTQPAGGGRKWSKGTIAMFITLPIAALGLALAATSMDQTDQPQTAQVGAAAQSPLVGQWSLDTQRLPAGGRPRQVTISFHLSTDQKWTTDVEMIGSDGTRSHAESTAALDGKAVPISGNMDFIDTVSLRQPAPNTLVMTLGKDGKSVSTRVYTVSQDRKTMKETIVWAGDKIPKLETTYFNRVG
ncbi:helix-turn-helix transcriptional regulator [Porphyrobacter algicida]|uniref:Helix-turn-helix transcriptional regulator n=1 Tax=Qipengyuania algicida TaxID=1836209 RepID=A0A845AF01_9SPHN|nr:helix-turn-helix transcriptional regulator [Qipengyuania algicida]MXP27803.1 helix-turn-helix transcriptional regulator [Qipengyuania algicida]